MIFSSSPDIISSFLELSVQGRSADAAMTTAARPSPHDAELRRTPFERYGRFWRKCFKWWNIIFLYGSSNFESLLSRSISTPSCPRYIASCLSPVPDLVLQGHIIPFYIVLPTPAMLSERATLCALMGYAALYMPLYKLLQPRLPTSIVTLCTALLGSRGGCVQVGGHLQMSTH